MDWITRISITFALLYLFAKLEKIERRLDGEEEEDFIDDFNDYKIDLSLKNVEGTKSYQTSQALIRLQKYVKIALIVVIILLLLFILLFLPLLFIQIQKLR